MPRAKEIIPRKHRKGDVLYFRVNVPRELSGGKRREVYRRNKADADRIAKAVAAERDAKLVGFSLLSGAERAMAGKALEMVGNVENLVAAAEMWSRLHVTERRTVAQLASECVSDRIRSGMSHRYIQSLGSTLRIFAERFGSVQAHAITSHDVTTWIHGENNWQPVTKRGRLIDVRTMFAFGIKRKYVAQNPVEGVEWPKITHKPPGIFTVDEAERLMRAIEQHDRGLIPYSALILFGGMRPDEAFRCRWEYASGDVINLPAGKAKLNHRRLIEVRDLPTLKAWLGLGGDMPPKNLKRRLNAIREIAKVPWSHDVLRHSFVSYAVPIHGISQTGLLADHSEAILKRHYRELVTRADAKKFWSILPQV
jgi:integrase